MKYLGIDFGGKRIGLAVSDEDRKFAFPLSVVENNSELIDVVKKVAEDNDIERIVIGDSKNLNFKDNPIMESINRFIKGWKERSDIQVDLYSEMFTSQAAARVAPKDELHDARAAALILQGYIDSKTSKN